MHSLESYGHDYINHNILINTCLKIQQTHQEKLKLSLQILKMPLISDNKYTRGGEAQKWKDVKEGIVKPGITLGLNLPSYSWISPHRHTQPWRVFLGIRKRCAHWSAGQMHIKLSLAKSGAFFCVSLPPGKLSSGVPASRCHRVLGPTTDKASSLDETKPPAVVTKVGRQGLCLSDHPSRS